MIDAGVIDPGYRGEIKVVLVNTSDYPYDVLKGTKIAQMVFERIPNVIIEEVAELPTADRGAAGFGSTDKQ
jgi:dUTP pyrophosphatase